MKQRIVIALGGNAIQEKGERGTYDEQMRHVRETMACILDLAADGEREVVITHGNGPQVGNILIQDAVARDLVPEMPLFVCDAMSQGEIGYLIQQSLQNLLKGRLAAREVVTVLTQVVVDAADPAFQNPVKPVGPFYTEAEAKRIAASRGYIFKEDAGRGYRRVVPSPRPLEIVEIGVIRRLMESGTVVIAGGGGGIPVINKAGAWRGVDAVIDKDRAGALLADRLDAEIFVVLTAVEKVSLYFGTPREAKLDAISLEDAKTYLAEGHFAEGSMKPKIEAAVDFVAANPTGRRALITHARVLVDALKEQNGTWIRR